jgi:outer membrane protein
LKAGVLLFGVGLALVISDAHAQSDAIPAPHVLVLNNAILQPQNPGHDATALDSTVTKVLTELMSRDHGNIVLDRGAVLAGADKVDITSETFALLRKELPAAGFPLVPIAPVDAAAVSAPRIGVLDKATIARARPGEDVSSDGELMRPILERLMQDCGATLILDSRAIIYATNGFDLTPAALQNLGPASRGASATLATAQVGPPMIVLLDSKAALRDSSVGRDVARHVKDLTQKLMAEMAPQTDALRKESTALDQEVAGSGLADHAQEVAAFSAKRQTFETMVDRRQMQIEEALDVARRKIDDAVSPIVQGIMRERGANILIDRAVVVIASAATFDITATAVQRLNQRLPALKLELPPMPAQ